MDTNYAIMSERDHAMSRTYMTGLFKRTTKMNALSSDNVFYKTKHEHSVALLKIIDEPISNCADVYIKTREATIISVSINPTTGEITVYNNGPGIPATINKEASAIKGKPTYTAEMLFTMFRAGSNILIDNNHQAIGMNALGIKLTNVHSEIFRVQTVDTKQKKLYTQEYRHGFGEIDEPIITNYHGLSYTNVSFVPSYKKFEYLPINADEMNEVIDIVRLRLVYLSMFFGEIVNITINDKRCDIYNTESFMKIMVPDRPIHTIQITHNMTSFMNISICTKIKNGQKGIPLTSSSINGCMVSSGTHFSYIKKKIINSVKNTSKDTTSTDIGNSIIMIICCKMPVTNWSTQNKDTFSASEKELSVFNVKESYIDSIAKELTDIMKLDSLRKRPKTKIDKKVIFTKYTPPKNRGFCQCNLLLAEGDSAKTLLEKLISVKGSKYTFDNTGIYSLGGVPSNISKMMTEVAGENGTMEVVSNEFFDSKSFGNLVKILNLDVDKTYTSVTVKTLPFKEIIICTDADTDGRGCICSLTIQMFYRLWPELFEFSYIKIWTSPVLRIVTPKGDIVAEFKEERLFDNYQITHDIKGKTVKYLKGLASHDDKYVPLMSKQFENDLITVISDENTQMKFDIYYGSESIKRKDELAIPTVPLSIDEIHDIEKNKSILINRHLDTQTKDFMLCALKRTIPALDGLTPVRRKIITILLKREIASKKIFQLTGKVADEMYYHHGEKSMNDAIIKMAQSYPGSNNYPLLKSDGQVGSRNKKGADAGSPRYVSVSLNKKLTYSIFNREDFPILQRNYEDGVEVEPVNFIPIIPLTILELRSAVSYAWSHKVYPRDINKVIEVLYKLIGGKKITKSDKELPPDTNNFKGNISIHDGVVTARGLYNLNETAESITITELPLWISPNKYVEILSENEFIHDIRNYSTDASVEIQIDCIPGSFAKIRAKYMSYVSDELNQFDIFLKIRQTFKEGLNFIDEKGFITHFDSAYDILYKNFIMNKEKYAKRIDRECLILKYLILREKNILRFLNGLREDNSSVRQIHMKDDEEIIRIFKDDEYPLINNTVLNTTDKYTTEQLITILESNGTFDYLTNTPIGDASLKQIDKRKDHLQKLYDRLKYLEGLYNEKPFTAASLYKTELDMFISACSK